MLRLDHLSIQFAENICVVEACATIEPGDRIALIGDNGAGKSSLLRALVEGHPRVTLAPGTRLGVLEQSLSAAGSVWEVALGDIGAELAHLEDFDGDAAEYEALVEHLSAVGGFDAEARAEALLYRYGLADYRTRDVQTLSGGERMRLGLVRMLLSNPNCLLLDEPTNHLDRRVRSELMTFLQEWKGAALVATHDEDVLREWPHKIWSLERGQLRRFDGEFEAFVVHRRLEKEAADAHFEELKRKKRALGAAQAKEAVRRARTERQGRQKYANEPLLAKGCAERAENTMGRADKRRVLEEKRAVTQELKELRESPVPRPRFVLKGGRAGTIEVVNGAFGYGVPLVEGFRLSVGRGDRLAVKGANGSGKTTLFKALLGDFAVSRTGEWQVQGSIGYLDQHYAGLQGEHTVLGAIKERAPTWDEEQVRRHLGAFLFLHQASLRRVVASLSEGEKARLAMAQIAASAPGILLLDEVTNNLDLRTKEHLVEVLHAYPGTLLVNSHSDAFLEKLGLTGSVVL